MSQNLPEAYRKVEKIPSTELPRRWSNASSVGLFLGVGALFWGLFINPLWWVWLIASGSGVLLGGSLAARAIQRRQLLLTAAGESQNHSDFKVLKQSFDKLSFSEKLNSFESEIQMGSQLCAEIQSKKVNFYQLLSDTFNTTELTYGRYELAFLDLENALFDHLKQSEYCLNNISTLASNLNEERQLRLQQYSDQINSLLAESEKALAIVDELILSLSQVKNEKDKGEIDLKSAIEQIEVLAQRAKKYSKEQ